MVKGRLGQEQQVSAAEARGPHMLLHWLPLSALACMSNDDTPQELVDQINAALRDLYDFNQLIWSALADQLDQRGFCPRMTTPVG